MLSIGAAMLERSHGIWLHVDADALQTACSNVKESQDPSINLYSNASVALPGPLLSA